MENPLRRTLVATAVLAASAAGAQVFAPLSERQARDIVSPIYEALNQPAQQDVAALLTRATSETFQYCGANDECASRDQVIARFKSTAESVPDLKWEIKELVVAGNRVVVRGEATGTPVRPVFGLTPTGRSFKVMSLDIHTIEGNRVVRTYHVENWTAAARQLSGN